MDTNSKKSTEKIKPFVVDENVELIKMKEELFDQLQERFMHFEQSQLRVLEELILNTRSSPTDEIGIDLRKIATDSNTIFFAHLGRREKYVQSHKKQKL